MSISSFMSGPYTLLIPTLSLLLLLIFSFILRKPGPARTSYPIIGCLISFHKNRHRLLDWYTDMLSCSASQTITLSRLGARRTILTANPLNVQHILKTNFPNYPKGKPFTDILGDFLGHGIFNVDGDTWRAQRRLVTRHFTATSPSAYVDRAEEKLIPALDSAAADGRPLDLQDLLRRLAFDLVCKISLGHDPRSVEEDLGSSTPHPVANAFDVASEMCARRNVAPLAAAWKAKRALGVGSEKRLKEAVETIRLFVDEIIRDRRSDPNLESKSDLLSKMVEEGESHDEAIRDTMISLVLAGRDTTSSAMTWLFYLLSRHPEVEDEVVRELGFVIDDNERFESLKLLKACICESMRIFPPVAWDSKHAISDDVLADGTRVRAGDRVTYFPYGIGRMKGLWGEDRLEFKPMRWVNEIDERGRVKGLNNFGPYKYPVFQAGPRSCPGKEMAFVQMKYVVALILRRFVVRPVSRDRPVFVPLLTAHMATGFKVSVQRR